MIEKMDEFFNARIDIYDEHMLNNAWGCKEGYRRLALEIPKGKKRLLDIGCGTGLELDEIFKIYPDIGVTGIDMAKSMLDRLSSKHADKDLKLIEANYLECDFGSEIFDAAISFQTLHHLGHADKKNCIKNYFSRLSMEGCILSATIWSKNNPKRISFSAKTSGYAVNRVYLPVHCIIMTPRAQ